MFFLQIFCHLRQLLGISRPTSVDGLSWTILRSSRENGVDNLQFDAETMTEHDSKLCVALDVLHECFVSIIEPRTQSDFVADLLFNREYDLPLSLLNFFLLFLIWHRSLLTVFNSTIIIEMQVTHMLIYFHSVIVLQVRAKEVELLWILHHGSGKGRRASICRHIQVYIWCI